MHCPTPGLPTYFFMKQWRHSRLASLRRTTGHQNLCRYPVHFQNCTLLHKGSDIWSGFISETRHQIKANIIYIHTRTYCSVCTRSSVHMWCTWTSYTIKFLINNIVILLHLYCKNVWIASSHSQNKWNGNTFWNPPMTLKTSLKWCFWLAIWQIFPSMRVQKAMVEFCRLYKKKYVKTIPWNTVWSYMQLSKFKVLQSYHKL